MLVRALKTFNGRYGKINKGQTFNAEPGYVKDLNKRKNNPLVEVLERDEPGPSQDRNKGEAPQRSGKDTPPAGGAQVPAGSEGQSGAGRGITSASLPVGRASTKTTSRASGSGGRRGTATPRKGKGRTANAPRDGV